MEIEFADGQLARLATDEDYTAGFSESLVKAFRRRIQYIKAAVDERDFYAMKSLHFERLKGGRQHQHSMRLNDQFRLILEFERQTSSKVVVIVSIEDYH